MNDSKEKKIVLFELDDSLKNKVTAPKNRWYYSLLTFIIAGIFIFLGVVVVALLVFFN